MDLTNAVAVVTGANRGLGRHLWSGPAWPHRRRCRTGSAEPGRPRRRTPAVPFPTAAPLVDPRTP